MALLGKKACMILEFAKSVASLTSCSGERIELETIKPTADAAASSVALVAVVERKPGTKDPLPNAATGIPKLSGPPACSTRTRGEHCPKVFRDAPFHFRDSPGFSFSIRTKPRLGGWGGALKSEGKNGREREI